MLENRALVAPAMQQQQQQRQQQQQTCKDACHKHNPV